MRQIILDTETTGLNARTGDRLIEIGCVELLNRRLTGNNLHLREPGARQRSGRTGGARAHDRILSDKPKFAEVAHQILDFVKDAELIIHNAPFDLGFLDAEFARLGLPPFTEHCGGVIDTLVQAKQMFPASATRSTRCATASASATRTVRRTAHCSTPELLAEVSGDDTRLHSPAIDMLDDGRRRRRGQRPARRSPRSTRPW